MKKHFETIYVRQSDPNSMITGEWYGCPSDHEDAQTQIDLRCHFHDVGYLISNEAVSGHRIIKTSTVTGRHVLLIEDPRGFSIQVDQTDLFELLNNVNVVEGVCRDLCTWLYTPKGLSLHGIRSSEYMETARRSYLRSSKLSLKDADRGDFLTLQNGNVVQYLGLCRFLFQSVSLHTQAYAEISKMYVCIERNDFGVAKLRALSSLNAAEIRTKNPMSLEQIQEAMYNIPRSLWDSNVAHAVFAAPCPFKIEDVEVEEVPYQLGSEPLHRRTFVGVDRNNFRCYTDWRSDYRDPLTQVKSLKHPTTFFPALLKTSSHDRAIEKTLHAIVDEDFLNSSLNLNEDVFAIRISLPKKSQDFSRYMGGRLIGL